MLLLHCATLNEKENFKVYQKTTFSYTIEWKKNISAESQRTDERTDKRNAKMKSIKLNDSEQNFFIATKKINI